jgi:5-hydroxyisourate hydrolase-like protein (transthyretin family)
MGAGLALALVVFAALTGCYGRRDGILPSTALVPTVVPSVEGAPSRTSPVTTPSPTVTEETTETAQATETATPVVLVAQPTALHTPPSTSVELGVAISPTNGPAGTGFRVVATGFRPETTVALGLVRHGGQVETVMVAQSDAEGRVALQLTIPDSAEPGDLYFVVAQILGQPVQAASNLFEVTEARGVPSVNVDPERAAAGDWLTVTGTGFPSETPVEIRLGPSDAEAAVLTTAQTHADGRIEVTLGIPASAAPGAEWVVTIATAGEDFVAVSNPVTIVAAEPPETATPETVATATATATATAEPATGQGVRLYLIALEDAGESGAEIGCGDSVVPVTVRIPPTMGVLRAALQHLLSLEGPDYGDSGLHNALHQSELTLGPISISQGHAIISLSGSLVLGGACDAPRVQAQLEQTALQFSTVNRVTITINGQPLESVLSGQ